MSLHRELDIEYSGKNVLKTNHIEIKSWSGKDGFGY